MMSRVEALALTAYASAHGETRTGDCTVDQVGK